MGKVAVTSWGRNGNGVRKGHTGDFKSNRRFFFLKLGGFCDIAVLYTLRLINVLVTAPCMIKH